MLRRLTLRTKLLTMGIVLTALPLLIAAAVTYRQNNRMQEVAATGCAELAETDLEHIGQGIYSMCLAQQQLLEKQLAGDLNVARATLTGTGQVGLGPEKVEWDASNQLTNLTRKVSLPRMMVGDLWLGQNRDSAQRSTVVDKVRELVSCACTIFQRMSPEGDMIRVCTNVVGKDGARAVGTFISAVNPDGAANPVISAVLKGDTYIGRAYVVDKWYITAYEPIRDAQNAVIGMLFVGVPVEGVSSLRKQIMDIKVGKTGYVYVLDSKGNYVISKDGKRDGECIWNAKDADGSLFIQEICAKAARLRPGEKAEQRYPWKNDGDAVARVKVANIVYFQPWDWIIGVGSYLDEFDAAAREVAGVGRASLTLLGGVTGGALLAASLIWFLFARGLSSRIMRTVEHLQKGADQTASAANQVSSASQSLAQGASEQAAAIEETTSSVEEMASMTKQNAGNANEAKNLAASTKGGAEKGGQAMTKMSQAIDDIKKSSDSTAKIVKTIDEIAFQTNLLALNAAVEAARAGEAGKGFAVVAEEVRNLAQRSAEAAKNTASMIEESVKNANNGVQISKEVGQSLSEIGDAARKVNDLVGEIAAASNEQSQGIEQINTAVGQLDQVTQQNAANAEESASASEELSAQAEEMNRMVQELMAMVGGAGSGAAAGGAAAVGKKHDLHFAHDTAKTATAARKPAARSKPGAEQRMPGGMAHPARLRATGDGKADPEKVIPMESDKELAKF